MWTYPIVFDVIVIGAGHAGSEAAHAAARMGASTLLLTMSLDTIGKMSCNPSIGGTAKGHIVREIDALGGLMGKVADRTGIQSRMLNSSKGPAVRSPRIQADKASYSLEMKHCLEKTPNLFIKQGTVEELIVKEGQIDGVITQEGIFYQAKTVVLSSGTFMRGMIHIGPSQLSGGRSGDKAAQGLSLSLEKLGFRLSRLKTGTPPRIHRRSIDFSICEEQPGEEGVVFSFDAPEKKLPQIPCHITYTTPKTHEIISQNLHRSPLFTGAITGVGPRYCPSIEDKVTRFPDKEKHQLFLEPEGLNTEEIYVNGISSSLPFDVQLACIQSATGLERAEIMRPAYAIEYDFANSDQIFPSLETKKVGGLFFAGQINGTTGYEEAAGQGLLAGINAALKVQNKEPFLLKRSDAYLGVMIDDLIRFDLQEPYRMFTSRAEHRLLLRQDNADLRLRSFGYSLGLITKEQHDALCLKKEAIETEKERLKKVFANVETKRSSIAQILCRPEWNYEKALLAFPEHLKDWGPNVNEQIEIGLKYEGYIEREKIEVGKLEHLDAIRIPQELDISKLTTLRSETKEKLLRLTPHNLGQASRIPGVTPADLSVLAIAIKQSKHLSR